MANKCHPPPSPEMAPTDFCPSITGPKISQWISFTYGPGAFQNCGLCPGTAVYLHELSKSRVAVFYSPFILLDISWTDIQSKIWWGLIFLVHILQFGVHDVGLKSLIPLGLVACLWYFFCGWAPGVWLLVIPCIRLFYPSWCGFLFLPICGITVLLILTPFPETVALYELYFRYVYGRRRVQDFPMLPSWLCHSKVGF